MSQAAFASPFPPSTQGARLRRADPTAKVTLGVFSDRGGWKVYSQFGSAAAYSSRQDALMAAQARASEAASEGRRVELFVEHEDGSLGQAWPQSA